MHGRHAFGQLSHDVVECLGAGEEPAVLREEVVDVRLARLAALEPFLEQRVEIPDHIPIGLEILGRCSLDRLRQAVDESIERLASELFGRRPKPLARRRLHEVVRLEAADLATDVARQGFELVETASRRVAQHRSQRRISGVLNALA